MMKKINATPKVRNKNVLAMINPIYKGNSKWGGAGKNLTLPWKPVIDKQFLPKNDISFFYEKIGLSIPYSNFYVSFSFKCFSIRFHFFAVSFDGFLEVLGNPEN